jgi:integrative and conjugative element protein (TIGR02256 family)
VSGLARTDGQRDALDQLQSIVAASRGTIEILGSVDGLFGLEVEISIDCRGFERKDRGFLLRQRERFTIRVPRDFPFDKPDLNTRHGRFAGHPHVQWRRHLCLYQAPSVEWLPSDGMFGFIDRVLDFLRRGALGELDAVGGPLHPPVAYPKSDKLVIPRADTPTVGSTPWLGFATLRSVSDTRVDITGWIPLEDTPEPPVAAAILLADSMPFEYPATVGALLDALAARGVSRRLLMLTLMVAVGRNGPDAPLYVVFGAPMRGTAGTDARLQHLSVQFLSADIVKAIRFAVLQFDDEAKWRELGEEAEAIFWEWAKTANVAWCVVKEDRPEVVVRRDARSPAAVFAGKTVALWGCGGLGSHVAMYLVRAGVRKIVLRDSGIVAPGILVRQEFVDADVGDWKADALGRQLQAIRPTGLEVITDHGDILTTVLEQEEIESGVDIVIETTGSIALAQKLERAWKRACATVFASMVVGSAAERGFLAVAARTHTGGISDVVRRGKLEVCNRGHVVVANDFWPMDGGTPRFQPEPGCSEPTFEGSAADVAQLAGAMLNRLGAALRNGTIAAADFVYRPDAVRPGGGSAPATFQIEPDNVITLSGGGEVRIAASAWREILAWVRRSKRVHGARFETGGVLFGERNTAANVTWVSEVSGPPPDSEASPHEFVCGTKGVAALNAEKRARTRRSVTSIGMWHTHPGSAPQPSPKDVAGMRRIISAVTPSTPNALLLIIGGDLNRSPTIGAHVFTKADFDAHP